jgi:hypothetical protein
LESADLGKILAVFNEEEPVNIGIEFDFVDCFGMGRSCPDAECLWSADQPGCRQEGRRLGHG